MAGVKYPGYYVDMNGMTTTLQAGMTVWVASIGRHGRPIETPVRATLMSHKPYIHSRGSVVTDGWDVHYPGAKEQWECHGGWKPTTSIHLQHPGNPQ